MSANFTVIKGRSCVDIAPHPSVTLSAEILLGIMQRIKDELGFKGAITAGTDTDSLEPTFRFGIRLTGAEAEVADKLRSMDDLFGEYQAEDMDVPEIRYVQGSIAYVDPRLVLPVDTYLAFADTLREQLKPRARLAFKDGQFFYHPNTYLDDLHEEMVELCRPLYAHTSELHGGVNDGHPWVSLTGPAEVLDVEKLANLSGILQNPRPVVRVSTLGNWPSRLWVFLDANSPQTAADVRRFYELAAGMSLALGIHPVGKFEFFHDEDLVTTYQPGPISSR